MNTLQLLLATLASAPIIAAAASTATSAPVARVPPSRQPDKQLVYKKTPQGEGGGELKFFIYQPPQWKASDKRPVILFFFGGGWANGSPLQFYSQAEYLASRGMVAICAEYRVNGTHKTFVKEAVEDARSAMRYLRKNAADLGVDPDKIIASGGSAGAHLAAALVTLNGPDAATDDLAISCKPNALVLFNPVYDLQPTIVDPELKDKYWPRIPGATEDEKKKYLAEFSPINYVKKDPAPTLAFYGVQDKFLSDARIFAKKSAALGNKIEILTAPNIGHGFFNAQPWRDATLLKTDEFLATLGYLQGPPTLKPTDPNATLAIDKPER